MLRNKKILLGITGSIAAYKSVLLVRQLVKAGADVKIVVTQAACDFVPVLTLSTLSKNKVLTQLADEDTWSNHVMLGRWADVMVIAPLSCNTLAKMAGGFCDNLLMAIYLSATCPVVVAPAMDEDMWHHPATMRNVDVIQSFGNKVISVGKGELASGLYGDGRMAEPEEIITYLEENFFRGRELANRKVLITAGPTYEPLDPVRFIGNHSSGKMGFAIAERFHLAGADVHIVCGATRLTTKYKGIRVSRVSSAQQMFEVAVASFPEIDIAVLAAAVADYKPLNVSPEKIKKSDEQLNIQLVKTIDILKHLGHHKSPNQFVVGFALETENERENAIRKLHSKNADLIILNSLRDEGTGFGNDTNKVTIFDTAGREYTYDAKSKAAVANDILQVIIEKLHEKA